jgi:hypothetical protein
MPVVNGIYLKDFPALPSSVADANIIPIAIAGNQIAYRTTVAGIVTDARVTSKLLTGLSVTGTAILATDTILQAFGKVQNQLNGKVTSVGLTMPAAFSVANSPITSAGTLAVTAAGLASQYIRGDGALADFPTTGGGGSSVSYYLNGSVSQGTFVGNTYYEMNKTPVIGTGTNFTINANGYIAQFITDANDPASLLIPAGNWNVEMYFSSSSIGGTPSFYVEVYKYDGSTFTLLGTSSATPEGITNGTAIDLYYTSVGIPETVLTITDRLAIRVYVTHSGRTITLHTEDNHLSEIVTTFSNGLTTLNGLTKQAQYFAVGSTGTDFAIVSSVDTHTFNIPSASASNRGALSSANWTTFNNKQDTITLTTTGSSGLATFIANTLNIPNYADGGVLSLSAIGATANANAATITGTVLNLQPASASFGGVVTTGTQTIAGAKTFSGTITIQDNVLSGVLADNVQKLLLSGNNPNVATGLYVRNVDNTASGRNIGGVYIEASDGAGDYYNSSIHTYGSNYNVSDFRGKMVVTNDYGTGTIIRSINTAPTSAKLQFFVGSNGGTADERLNITNTAANFSVPLVSPTLTTPILGVFAATSGAIVSSSTDTGNPSDSQWLTFKNSSNTNNNWSGIGMKDAQGNDGVIYATQYVDHSNNQADAVIFTRPSGGNVTESARFSSTNATFPGNISAANLTSGTYTPTLTNGTNVDSSSPNVCQYTRVGNIVTVFGMITIDATTLNSQTDVDISLPIASALTSENELNGTTTSRTTASGVGFVKGNATNDRATLSIFAGSILSTPFYFSFSYQVL